MNLIVLIYTLSIGIFIFLLNCFEDKFEYNDSNYNEELPKVTSDNTNKNQEQNQVIIYNRKDNDQAEERKEEGDERRTKELYDENIMNEKIEELKKEKEDLGKKIEHITREKEDLKKKIDEITREKETYKKGFEEMVNNRGKYSIEPIKPGEKVISINFVSMGNNDIGHFSLACKNTDLFIWEEERLYENFPDYKKVETYFEANGKRIKRFQTLDKNGIKDNDIINMFIIE